MTDNRFAAIFPKGTPSAVVNAGSWVLQALSFLPGVVTHEIDPAVFVADVTKGLSAGTGMHGVAAALAADGEKVFVDPITRPVYVAVLQHYAAAPKAA